MTRPFLNQRLINKKPPKRRKFVAHVCDMEEENELSMNETTEGDCIATTALVDNGSQQEKSTQLRQVIEQK